MAMEKNKWYSKELLEQLGILVDKGNGKNFYWKSSRDGKILDVESNWFGKFRMVLFVQD